MENDASVSSRETHIGPYAVVQELAGGAFSRMYLAEAPDDGRRVLLKVARSWDMSQESTFRQEFQLGSRLLHPHLGELLDHGRTELGRPYLVLAFYAGETLAERSGPWPEAELLQLGLRLARALDAIHREGLAHRDLSPANVLIEAGGNLRLIDFGMLAPVGAPSTGGAGTPLYMAPEAIEGRPVDTRADLYAFGALLYRLACGEAPFETLAAEALLAATLKTPPTPIAERAPQLSPALAALIMRCLAKEPGDRPESAQALAQQLARLLETPVRLPLAEGAWRPSEAFAAWEACASEPGVYAFTGAQGLGRTRHLQEAFRQLRRADRPALLLAAEAGDGPYALVERLWRWLAAWAPEAVNELPIGLREQIASLWPWAYPHVRPAKDPARLTRTLQQALGSLLSLLDAGRGLAVLVDDWETVDAASRAVLAGGFATALAPFHFLLASHEPPAAATAFALAPFPREAIAPWLASCWQGELPAGLDERLWSASEGNPGWMALALRHLQDAAPEAEAEALAIPASIGPMLEGQWGRLSLEQRTLAEALALYAVPFVVGDLVPLAEVLPANWPLELTNLVAREFLTVSGGTYRFRHGWWPSWIREQMPAPRRARLAEKLARALEPPAGSPERDALLLHRIATLFAQSDLAEPKIRTAQEAGLALARLYANEGALAHFMVGLKAIEVNPDSSRFAAQRLAMRIAQADVQRLTGELEAACRTYQECLAELQLAGERGRLLVSLGKTRQMLNQFEAAREAFEEALAILKPLPEAGERLRGLTALGRVLYYLGERDAAAERYREALALAQEHEDLAYQAEALSLLGNSLVEAASGTAEGLAYLQQALAIRERLGDQLGSNDTHMLLGNALLTLGRYREALTHFEANRSLSRQVGHKQEQAFACLNLALCETELGSWRLAILALDEARELAASAKDGFLLGLGRFIESLAQLHLGQLPAVEACLAEAREREAALGSPYLRLYGLLYEAERHLFLGSFEQARRAAELALGLIEKGTGPETRLKATLLLAEAWLNQDQYTQAGKQLAAARTQLAASAAEGPAICCRRLEGWLAFRQGRFAEARAAWEPALGLAQEQGLAQLEVRLLLDLHLLARQDVAAGVPLADLSRAYMLAEQLRMPECLALACLGLALKHLEDGQDLLAERLSRRGHELLGHFTQALPSQGARQAFLGHPMRAPFCEIEELEEAHRLVQKSRRLEMLLALGHTIGTTREVDKVLEQVRVFTLEVTQAERCLVLLQAGKGPLRLYGQKEQAPYSHTIVERVVETRESACVLDTQSDEDLKAQASIMDLQVRSVMCVPLLVGSVLHGVLYVDSRVALGAFTPDDLRMLTAIAGQAAVAIDNARLHTALRGELQRKEDYIKRLEASEHVIRNLEELDRVRAEFFQAASHDLRAPLASINASCQALLKGLMDPLTSDQAETIEGVHHASRTLMSLIDGILDGAQLEAGKLYLHTKPLPLVRPVKEAVRLLQALAEGKGLAIRWDETALAALPPVKGDERRLQQVLLNLLANAIKFTEVGGVSVSARALPEWVELVVADTGPGLPAERRANPFERFGVQGTARPGAGNGLGLWMVKGLVELHQGQIRVQSEPGKGTRFSLLLPLG